MEFIKRLFKNNGRENKQYSEEDMDRVRRLYRFGWDDPAYIAKQIGRPENIVVKMLEVVRKEGFRQSCPCDRTLPR